MENSCAFNKGASQWGIDYNKYIPDNYDNHDSAFNHPAGYGETKMSREFNEEKQ